MLSARGSPDGGVGIAMAAIGATVSADSAGVIITVDRIGRASGRRADAVDRNCSLCE